jgi:hypothetical protein
LTSTVVALPIGVPVVGVFEVRSGAAWEKEVSSAKARVIP